MILHWPQISLLIILILNLSTGIIKDGELKTGSFAKHSAWASILNCATLAYLLYAGNFWMPLS